MRTDGLLLNKSRSGKVIMAFLLCGLMIIGWIIVLAQGGEVVK